MTISASQRCILCAKVSEWRFAATFVVDDTCKKDKEKRDAAIERAAVLF